MTHNPSDTNEPTDATANAAAPNDGPPVPTERIIDIATDLLAIDTQNPPGDVRPAIAYVEELLSTAGFDSERIATDPTKPNLIATVSGESDRTLLYNGHVDTVPFEREAWDRDPLGEHDGDRIYGRGATDMKGPLAAMLAAGEALATADRDPPVSVAFAVVSDEETGGDAGVDTLVERGALDRLAPDGCVIGETTCSGGRHSVTVADRGSIWLTLRASGTAAHGSRPFLGDNAIDRLWEAVSLIRSRLSARDLRLDATLRPIVEESVAFYEPTLGASTARDLFEHPTVNLGTIEGGETVNTVPDSAMARLDVRLTAGVDTADVLADIRECLADFTAVFVADASWSLGSHEPIESPIVEAVTQTAGSVTGDRIYRRSATGGGDAKTFRHAGVPTVEFGFGTDTVHAVDEYTTVEALRRNAAVYARLPTVWNAMVS
ncbi:M20 family metallopeptidase [Halorubrum lacusprofundi]|jgi:succinyl-diaminopimelate desuccinylase|uniref:Acetylornithine deacetylase or succinyl-diaminopimelate desuccinylase n=1 Tax=Halorubrum lacusprofundi (strain ATCC 49239 / DSM 5036 / JCM 8891 / ACAM 34) TaxID=416348 RepID=B9LSQ3_HALLT|nr:M20/M25/M40 family metallo-hydrolase [Halorubrum lacusprofundi]ACM58000.1 acetylornithine deacetylase or succinyl-diaminopimelate desuccinylase [Halorubrum lacusprofundi ATCC 49239]MCG1007936.1 M20/M25/M40 family metallo-hydrolase [Halorubrum lacusprofundi]